MLDSFNFVIVLPIISCALFLIACIIPMFVDPLKFTTSRLAIFIQILAPIGVIMIGLSIFNSSADFELRKESQKTLLYKERLSSMFLQPTVEIFMTPNVRPEFYASFYYNNRELYELTKDLHTPSTPESTVAEQYVALKVLQSYEDYIQYQSVYDTTQTLWWLAVFIQWGQSRYLQQCIEIMPHSFESTTIEFAKIIFECSNSLPIPALDAQIYIKYAAALRDYPRFKEITQKIIQKGL